MSLVHDPFNIKLCPKSSDGDPDPVGSGFIWPANKCLKRWGRLAQWKTVHFLRTSFIVVGGLEFLNGSNFVSGGRYTVLGDLKSEVCNLFCSKYTFFNVKFEVVFSHSVKTFLEDGELFSCDLEWVKTSSMYVMAFCIPLNMRPCFESAIHQSMAVVN